MNNAVFPPAPVLIVDDEENVLEVITETLSSKGINNTISCQDSRKVMAILSAHEIEIVLLDLIMPHVSGDKLLPEITGNFPEIPVIILTGLNDLSTAVECMKAGAFDYMVKAVEESRLISGVKRAIEIRELRQEYSSLKKQFLSTELKNPEVFSGIITNNVKMRSLFLYMESISTTSHPVLIMGETGVGKGLIAKVIHNLSGVEGEYIAVNVSGFDDALFSDNLFGHKKGAFTGADQPRAGMLNKAFGGTLFLDEIGDLSSSSQIKLLRLLEEREYFPLGSDMAIRSETHIIVATKGNLAELVDQGQFRKDLYYRIKTHEIEIPPLRERMDDLPLLIDHFLHQAASEMEKTKPTPPPELFTLLGSYDFPGNIRELKSMIIDAVSRHKSKMLSLESFKTKIGKKDIRLESKQVENLITFSARFPTLKQIDTLLINEALKRSRGNLSVAAKLLGLSHQALSKRLKRSAQKKHQHRSITSL